MTTQAERWNLTITSMPCEGYAAMGATPSTRVIVGFRSDVEARTFAAGMKQVHGWSKTFSVAPEQTARVTIAELEAAHHAWHARATETREL